MKIQVLYYPSHQPAAEITITINLQGSEKKTKELKTDREGFFVLSEQYRGKLITAHYRPGESSAVTAYPNAILFIGEE